MAVRHAWRWNLARLGSLRAERGAVQRLRRLDDAAVRRLQLRGSARLTAYARRAVTSGLRAAHIGAAADAAVGAAGRRPGPTATRAQLGRIGPGPGDAMGVGCGRAAVRDPPAARGRTSLCGPAVAHAVHRKPGPPLLVGLAANRRRNDRSHVARNRLLGRVVHGARGVGRCRPESGRARLHPTGCHRHGPARPLVRIDVGPAGVGPRLPRPAGRLRRTRHGQGGRIGGLRGGPVDLRPPRPGHGPRPLRPRFRPRPWCRPGCKGPRLAHEPGGSGIVPGGGHGRDDGGGTGDGRGHRRSWSSVSSWASLSSGGCGASPRRDGSSSSPWAPRWWPSCSWRRGHWPSCTVPARWQVLTGVAVAPASGPQWSELLRLALGPIGDTPLAWAFLAAAALPLAIGARWRLAWAGQVWIVTVVCWGAAWAGGRGWLGGFAVPAPMLLAPAAVGLAVAVGLGVRAFEVDLPAHSFGWRQGLARGGRRGRGGRSASGPGRQCQRAMGPPGERLRPGGVVDAVPRGAGRLPCPVVGRSPGRCPATDGR